MNGRMAAALAALGVLAFAAGMGVLALAAPANAGNHVDGHSRPAPGAVASPAGPAGVAGLCGGADSEVRAQYALAGPYESVNLDTTAETDGDRSSHRFQFAQVDPVNGAMLRLGALRFMADGRYAGTVRSHSEVGAISRTDWPDCGGSAVNNHCREGIEVIVPYAAYAHGGETSIVAVQNVDPDQATQVSLELYATGGTVPVFSTHVGIAAARSATLDLAGHPAFADLPPGFVGWMRVTAAGPVAVQSWVDLERPRSGVFAFEGLPADRASDLAVAPIVYADAPMVPNDASTTRLSSRIAVVNAGAAGLVMTVEYHGIGHACRGGTYAGGTRPLAAGEGAILDLAGPDAADLPEGCIASALLGASVGGRLAAAVLTQDAAGDLAAAYTALARAPNSNSTDLPLVRKEHGPESMTSAIAVTSRSALPATVWIAFVDECGRGLGPGDGPWQVTLTGRGDAHLWWLGDIDAIPAGTLCRAVLGGNGSEWVTAVLDVPLAGGMDAASYTGLAWHAGAVPRFPLLLRDSAVPLPTSVVCPPTQPPTEPATAAATPSPSATAPPVTPTATRTTAPPATRTTSGTPGAPGTEGPTACRYLLRRVPPAAIADALANPERFAGWDRLCRENLPASPWNGRRHVLTLLRPNVPYHDLHNPLVYRCGCP